MMSDMISELWFVRASYFQPSVGSYIGYGILVFMLSPLRDLGQMCWGVFKCGKPA